MNPENWLPGLLCESLVVTYPHVEVGLVVLAAHVSTEVRVQRHQLIVDGPTSEMSDRFALRECPACGKMTQKVEHRFRVSYLGTPGCPGAAQT